MKHRKNEKTLEALTAIFNKTLEHGFPVHRCDELQNTTYRQLEYHQKCAEKAMLATLTSLWLVHNDNNESDETSVITLHQFRKSDVAALHLITRLFPSGPRAMGIFPTLSGLSLEGSYLQEVHLRFADLEGTDLSETILVKADLLQVNLRRANLQCANLRRAELWKANLSGANLRGAKLLGASLSGANLSETNLWGASLREANLTLAEMNKAILGKANLERANLCGANMNNAQLWLVDLSEANLRNVNLRGANLHAANLNGAVLESTDLTSCCTDAMSVRSVDFRKDIKLTQEQVNAFFGVKSGAGKTLLPDHLSYPDHWQKAEINAEAAPLTAIDEYQDSWSTWTLNNGIDEIPL